MATFVISLNLTELGNIVIKVTSLFYPSWVNTDTIQSVPECWLQGYYFISLIICS